MIQFSYPGSEWLQRYWRKQRQSLMALNNKPRLSLQNVSAAGWRRSARRHTFLACGRGMVDAGFVDFAPRPWKMKAVDQRKISASMRRWSSTWSSDSSSYLLLLQPIQRRIWSLQSNIFSGEAWILQRRRKDQYIHHRHRHHRWFGRDEGNERDSIMDMISDWRQER